MFLNETATLIKDIIVVVTFIGSVIAILRKLKIIVDASKCQLRSDITAIYYKHVDEENPTLREYERKNLDELYEGYHTLRGNHFVDDLYKKMRNWTVVN